MDSANKDLSHSLNRPNNNRDQDVICPECENNDSFRRDFDDAVTSVDRLPADFKENNGRNCKLQELVD